MGSDDQNQASSDARLGGGVRWIAVSALFVAFALTAWIGIYTVPLRQGADTAARDQQPERPTHVVIFLIDTLRADSLGVYGYERSTSPNIDALAAESAVFDACYAPAPWTLPSVASLMTAQFLCEHGVVLDGQRVSDSVVTIAKQLQSAGYATGSFYANPYAGPMTGLDRGFNHCAFHGATDGSIVDAWLATAGVGPFFAYIHNVEPHDPYLAPRRLVEQFGSVSDDRMRVIGERLLHYRRLTRVDFASGQPLGTTDNTEDQREAMRRVRDDSEALDVLYAASVRDADEKVGSVIDTLQRRGIWNDTLFIVTSDHGEEFDDHGGWQHDQSVYEELVRVPLIVRFPDASIEPRRIDAAVSLVDVMPTIIDYLGQDVPSSCRGDSLMPLVRSTAQPATDAISVPSIRVNRKKYFRPYKESRGDTNIVLRDGRWKGILNVEVDTFELYDLGVDPAESSNVATQHPRRVERMRDRARHWLKECVTAGAGQRGEAAGEMSDAVRERLRSLGYVD